MQSSRVSYNNVLRSTEEHLKELITEKIHTMLTVTRQEIVSQLEATLSQSLDEHLTMLDIKQAGAMAHLRYEQASMITETVTSMVETVLQKCLSVTAASASPSKVRSITDTPSHRYGCERDIDKIIWPLLEAWSMSTYHCSTS